MVASVIFSLGLVFLLFALWELSGIWFEQKDSRKLRSKVLISRLATIRPKAAMTELALKDWALIIAVVVPTAIFTRQPILTLGAGIVLYLTRAFFGKDPMEARLKTMEDNIVWMQTLTYLLQTSKSAFESLEISAKALPEETGRQLRESLLRANTSIGGYVIRLRDALTMFAIRRADPQVDVVVAMVNANITSSGTTQDYKVMQQIQEQLKSELIEQNAAVSARREIFTIAKIMFPMVVIMESALSVMMGNFIEPYYRTAKGDAVLIFIELMTVGLLVLFRKISAPLPEIRLIVPETFMESLNKNMAKVSAPSGRG
jgi:hypothetical protein